MQAPIYRNQINTKEREIAFIKKRFRESGIMPGIGDKEEAKSIVKEALKEWLDEKFALLGQWSLGAIAAAVLAALTYFVLWSNGWHK